MESYHVTFNDENVGTVTVERQGLYFVISCRCRRIAGVLRLVLQREKERVPIGVCIPEGSGMGICRRLPAKHLKDPPWHFFLAEDKEENFVPLGGELSTDVLQNLYQARFCLQDGKPGLVFPHLPSE